MIEAAGGVLIAGAGSALPPAVEQEALWEGFFAGRNPEGRRARTAFLCSGVRRRHAAFDPRREDVSTWSTGRRMAAYLAAALPLAAAAAHHALGGSGVAAAEVGLVVVTSCTGYAAPGIDVLLARDLGLPADARRLVVGHLGCHAALPALATASEYVAARGRSALLVCAELASLHVQPGPDGGDQAVTHALFGDAAAALVLTPGRAGRAAGAGPPLAVVDHEACSDVDQASAMTWEVGDLGFVMGLSRRVPELLPSLAVPAVEALLRRNGLRPADVAAWAIHPGGPRIVEAAGACLGLCPGALDASLAVLASRGNCSSATVLLVLEELRRRGRPGPGEPAVLLAFGPGLTCYASLLRGA